MPRPKARVLLDLSMAARGYCGIAQDVRLLYKTLAACPDLEVTGLVYPPQKLTLRHRFCAPRASRAKRLANQSEFLWRLSDAGFDWRGARPWSSLGHLRAFVDTLVGRSAKCDLLDVESLQDTLWRVLFSQTLAPQDLPLVARGEFLLANLSDGMLFARVLGGRRSLRLDTRGYDFLIVQGPRPFRCSRGTQQIVRYHDMIPLLAPDTMSNSWVMRWHHRAIHRGAGSFFVCNSQPTQDTLTAVYPELAECSTTIPYALCDVYRPQRNPDLARSIIVARRSSAAGAVPPQSFDGNPRYLMCVSALEPRKNIGPLIRAFECVKARAAARSGIGDLKLLLVGHPGASAKPVLSEMREPVERGEVIHLQDVLAEELRVLYTHAEALAFPSHAEGFGFPPLEAMQCDTPAIVSDIAAHRWVMGDAALYCNPNDAESIAAAIARLVDSHESGPLRARLIERGRRRVTRYSLEGAAHAWTTLLHQLLGGAGRASEPASAVRGVSSRQQAA